MSRLTIVMYHYVRELRHSRYPRIRGLEVSQFKEQVHFLRKHYNIVSAEQVIAGIEGQSKLPQNAVLLTFDDGYLDHFNYVFPVLDQLGLKGCFYIPTRAITERIVLDVNKIHIILASEDRPDNAIKVVKELLATYAHDYPIEPFEEYWRRHAKASRFDSAEVMFLKRMLQHGLDEEVRAKIVNEMFSRTVDMDDSSFSNELYMNVDQIQTMLKHGMHIGNHGHNHYWWNKLSLLEITKEIDTSVALLRKMGVNMNTWTACYPYGSHDEQSAKILEATGCRFALTTVVEVAEVNEQTRLTLPRLDTNDLPKDRNAEVNVWYEPRFST